MLLSPPSASAAQGPGLPLLDAATQGLPTPRQVDLLSGSASEVLERILPEDPLGLRQLLGHRMRERAVLLDLDRLLLALFVRVAQRAEIRQAGASLRAWLLQQIDGVLDRELHRDQGKPATSSLDPFAPRLQEDAWWKAGRGLLVQLARSLDLDPERLSASRSRFHRLDREVREAFFTLVLEGRSLEQAARRGGKPAPQLVRHARTALSVFCAPEESPLTPQPLPGS